MREIILLKITIVEHITHERHIYRGQASKKSFQNEFERISLLLLSQDQDELVYSLKFIIHDYRIPPAVALLSFNYKHKYEQKSGR